MGGRLKCLKAHVMIEELLDDQLDESGRIALDEHLSQCTSCRDYREGSRRTRELLQEQPLNLASDAAVRRMWGKLEKRLDEPVQVVPPARRTRWHIVAAAAMVALVAGAALTWFSSNGVRNSVDLVSADPVIEEEGVRREAPDPEPSPELAPPPPEPSARFVAANGSIRLSRGELEPDTPVARGASLLAGDRLATDAESTASFRIGDVISAYMGPRTTLDVRDLSAESPSLELVEGWVVFEVSPLEPSATFDVGVRGARVRVVGTVFAVETLGEEEVEVRVVEGRVEVSTGDNEPVIVNSEHTAELPRATVVELDDELTTRDRALARGDASPRPSIASPPDIDELFEQAEEARRAGRHTQAASLYRRIATMDRSGASGGTALISLGQICLGRLGRPGEARRAFETYLSRHERGPLSQEAYVGLMRAHRASGRADSARRVARQYLDVYSTGRYRHIAEEILERHH